jgi:hypothetical protein
LPAGIRRARVSPCAMRKGRMQNGSGAGAEEKWHLENGALGKPRTRPRPVGPTAWSSRRWPGPRPLRPPSGGWGSTDSRQTRRCARTRPSRATGRHLPVRTYRPGIPARNQACQAASKSLTENPVSFVMASSGVAPARLLCVRLEHGDGFTGAGRRPACGESAGRQGSSQDAALTRSFSGPR